MVGNGGDPERGLVSLPPSQKKIGQEGNFDFFFQAVRFVTKNSLLSTKEKKSIWIRKKAASSPLEGNE